MEYLNYLLVPPCFGMFCVAGHASQSKEPLTKENVDKALKMWFPLTLMGYATVLEGVTGKKFVGENFERIAAVGNCLGEACCLFG